MWTRKELKSRAKDVLRKNYLIALFVSVVVVIAGGKVPFAQSSWRNSWKHETPAFDGFRGNMDMDFGFSENIFVIIGIILLAMMVMVILAIAFRIFLGYPLEVGGMRFFVRAGENGNTKECFRWAFKGGNYGGIVRTMLLRSLFNFFWFLLFLIPGFIKAYAYRMVPYILADNPNIGASRAIDLSRKMMDGEKWDTFVLDLSFIGWYILGSIALVVGTVFVMPYHNATVAELYMVLRTRAIEAQWTSGEELHVRQVVPATVYDADSELPPY